MGGRQSQQDATYNHPFQNSAPPPPPDFAKLMPFIGHVITVTVLVVGLGVMNGRMSQRMDMYEANADRQRVTIERLTEEIHTLGKIIVRLQTQQEDSGMDIRIDRRPR